MDEFFSIIEVQHPNLKRVGDRPYAHMRLTPRALVTLDVSSRNKTVSVGLETAGTEKDLCPDALLEWVNNKGFLREAISGKSFEVLRGKKNKKKLGIRISFGFESLDELAHPEGSAVLLSVNRAVDFLMLHLDELAHPTAPKTSPDSQDATDQNQINFAKLVSAGNEQIPFGQYLVNVTSRMLRKEDEDEATSCFNQELLEYLENEGIESDWEWWHTSDQVFKDTVRFVLSLPSDTYLDESFVIKNILDNAIWDGKEHLREEDPVFWSEIMEAIEEAS